MPNFRDFPGLQIAVDQALPNIKEALPDNFTGTHIACFQQRDGSCTLAFLEFKNGKTDGKYFMAVRVNSEHEAKEFICNFAREAEKDIPGCVVKKH